MMASSSCTPPSLGSRCAGHADSYSLTCTACHAVVLRATSTQHQVRAATLDAVVACARQLSLPPCVCPLVGIGLPVQADFIMPWLLSKSLCQLWGPKLTSDLRAKADK